MDSFGMSLEMFKRDNGHYPVGTNALNDLVVQPQGAKNWPQYMQSIPWDPWGHAYIYECPGKHRTNSYDLLSMGPDGIQGTADDIAIWQSVTNAN